MHCKGLFGMIHHGRTPYFPFHLIQCQILCEGKFAALTDKIVKSREKEKVLRKHIQYIWIDDKMLSVVRGEEYAGVQWVSLTCLLMLPAAAHIYFDMLHWKRFASTDFFLYREKDQKASRNQPALIKLNTMWQQCVHDIFMPNSVIFWVILKKFQRLQHVFVRDQQWVKFTAHVAHVGLYSTLHDAWVQ